MPDIDSDEYVLGICIAEKFRDLFEYAEPLATKVDYDFAWSFNEYMERIMNTPIYKKMDEMNPIMYNSRKNAAGEELKIGMLLKNYLEKNKPNTVISG